jgi:4-amino-4-deoxy-L-arabinose transferase-like glycosyltransferase
MENNLLERIISKNRNFILALLFLLFISIILNVILYYAGFFSISADESGRTVHAYKWINGLYNGIPTWLPFHTIVVGYGLKLFPDLFWTPRIIISFFGVLAFVSFIWLAHELFKDRYITLLSAVIALFFPTRVILSTVPLSESMYFFFIFSGIALFTRWLRNNQNYLLILSAASFAISSSVRYEGWLFMASLILVLIIFRRLKSINVSLKNIIVVSLIGLVFPLYWFTFQAAVSDNPLHFLYDVNRNFEHSVGISFVSILKHNYLTRFVHHNLIYICFPGIVILAYLFLRDGIIRKWMLLSSLAFIPLILVSFFGKGIPTHNIWRAPDLWNILLIPFVAYFLKNINSFVSETTFGESKFLKSLKKGIVPLIIIVMLIYYSFHIYRYAKDDNFSKDELRIGRYIEKNLIDAAPGSKILIEVPDWSYLHIIIASNNPEKFIKNFQSGNPRIMRDPVISDESSTDLAELSDRRIKYILLKSEELINKIKLNPFFKSKKEFKEWVVFEFRKEV